MNIQYSPIKHPMQIKIIKIQAIILRILILTDILYNINELPIDLCLEDNADKSGTFDFQKNPNKVPKRLGNNAVIIPMMMKDMI